MTDNDIIKALECCMEHDCDNCPYELGCHDNIIGDSLSLINRQKAEIERLKVNIVEAHIDIEEHMAEIKRLKEANKIFADIGKMYSEIKAEAIKDFVERFESVADVVQINAFESAWQINGDDWSNLLKETVGEQ